MSITLDGAAFYAKVENIRQELIANVSTQNRLFATYPKKGQSSNLNHICSV